MLLGLALIVVGTTLILRNRQLAITLGFDEQSSRWGFLASAARQNFAVVGAVIAIIGVASMLLL